MECNNEEKKENEEDKDNATDKCINTYMQVFSWFYFPSFLHPSEGRCTG